MTKTAWPMRWGWIPSVLSGGLWILSGCTAEKRVEPQLKVNPDFEGMAIAVAPAVNLSGSRDFDRNRFADLMAVELGYADGISVIPVSRVLGVLASEGRDDVASPSHALELAELLGADAILVFAVTDYDPYEPPRVGISAQLHGTRLGPGGRSVDPVAFSRKANLAASAMQASPQGLLAQTQRVFDASHESVVEEIKVFAGQRSADYSPYGWRKYVVSQQHFIQYCCHAVLRAILDSQDDTGLAERNRER